MNSHFNLIEQLEDILAGKDISRRAEILRKVTDLFVAGSGRFSEDQVELFDSVMGALLENIERAARAHSSEAGLPDFPMHHQKPFASSHQMTRLKSRDQFSDIVSGLTKTL